ncbi:hypothetical protein [Rheinheimera gaetbuli]
MKQASHQRADRTYAQLREQSRMLITEELPVRFRDSVTFDDINGRAMAQLSRGKRGRS